MTTCHPYTNRAFPNQQSGIALIVVLWIVLVISLIIGGILVQLRLEVRQSAFQREIFLAKLAIGNAIETLKFRLSKDTFSRLAEQNALTINTNGYKVSIEIVQEYAQLADINVLPAEALKAFFSSHGIEEEQGRVFADRIIDWRDVDTKPEKNGAEISEYLRENKRPPGNRPFYTANEISNVLGLEALPKEVRDKITVTGRTTHFQKATQVNDQLQDSQHIGRVLLTRFKATKDNQDSTNEYSQDYILLFSGNSATPIYTLAKFYTNKNRL